jgi:hypothetical protein
VGHGVELTSTVRHAYLSMTRGGRIASKKRLVVHDGLDAAPLRLTEAGAVNNSVCIGVGELPSGRYPKRSFTGASTPTGGMG